MMPAPQALFYSSAIARSELLSLVAGFTVLPPTDLVEFADENGGDVGRELGLPFLPGMDEVQVDSAQLRLRTYPQALEIDTYSVTQIGSGANQGVILVLANPGRLSKLELSAPQFPPTADPDPAKTQRIVIRPATGTAPNFSFGPPIFAAPAFPAPGPMFGPVLGGIDVQDLGGKRLLIKLPSVLGTAWLIQLAVGQDATKLAAQSFTPTVKRVVLDAAPRNVSLTMEAPDGAVPLWSYPNALLPDVGVQEISFTPLAENALQKQLGTASGAANVTLAIPLRFQSASGGALEIVSKTLSARYLLHPLGPDPVTLNLRGSRTALDLNAPAGLRPTLGTVRLVAQLLGRELNAGSSPPPLARPTTGIRFNPARWAAARLPFEPLPSATVGSILPLVSVRVCLAALDDAEVALEVHSDVAGVPGPSAAPPVVRQITKGTSDWVEFELKTPLPVVTGQAPVWVVLRSTKGDLLWFTDGPGAPRISVDRGASWGLVDPQLMVSGAPLAQLFHQVPEPAPLPAPAPAPPPLALSDGAVVIDANVLAGAIPDASRREYVRDAYALPPAVLQLLAATTGSGRTTTKLLLFGRAVMDLTLQNMTLSYSPFGSSGG